MASDCSYELLSNLNPAQCGVGNVTNRQIATSLWQILGIKVSLNRHTLDTARGPWPLPWLDFSIEKCSQLLAAA
jgi:hypothetical protein